MGKFEVVYGNYHYTDDEGDMLEISDLQMNTSVYLNTGPDGIAVPAEDLIPLFERMAEMVDVKGTFVPKSENEVTTRWGRTRCGVGESEASVLNGVPAETVRELAANLLSIADTLDEEVEWQKTFARLAKKAAEAAQKKAHNDLRSSKIALEALELYKRRDPSFVKYGSWDDTNAGMGSPDAAVKRWIGQAEGKREESQPQVGDLVRVAADAKTVEGHDVHFGRSVVGDVVTVFECGDRHIETKDPKARVKAQVVGPQFLTVIARSEEVETLRDSALLGVYYEELSVTQKHLVDEIIAMQQEKK